MVSVTILAHYVQNRIKPPIGQHRMRLRRIPITSKALEEAAFRGMRWLKRSTRQPEGFTSDEPRCFLIVSRSARDPRLTDYASRIHRQLIKSFNVDLKRLREMTHPFDFIDYLSFCSQSEDVGFTHRNRQRIEKAVFKHGEDFFWNLDPRKLHVMNCITLINYYHFKRLRFPMRRTMEEVINACRRTALDGSRPLSADEFEQQLYFITHWAYALSDYGCVPLSAQRHARLYRFLRSVLPAALEYGNIETLSEVVACLKIFGHRNRDAYLRPALQNILRRQNPDGSWGSVHYGTARHATCVAVLALYEYRAHRDERWGPPAKSSRF
jgi:hypothetical protein